VNVDRNPEAMKDFLRTNKIEWPQYWDGQELRNKVIEQTIITRAGTIVLIDMHGVVRKYDGDEDLGDEVQALLKEP
jgi:hypothetical protein